MFTSPLAWAAQLPNRSLPCLSCSHYSLQDLWHVAVSLPSTWSGRNSHHQGGSTLATEPGSRTEEPGSQKPAVARSCPCLLQLGSAESPGTGTIAWVKVAEELRDLGTRWNRSGQLVGEICNTLLPSQNSHSRARAWRLRNHQKGSNSSTSQRVDMGRQA